MEHIRARFGHGVDDGAGHATVLRVVTVGQHLDFADDLLAVALRFAAGALPGDAEAVHLIPRGVAAGRARANVAEVAARARHHRDQVEPVASVERKLLHLLGVDVPGELRLLRVDERGGAADRDRLLQLRDLHREVDRDRLADAEPESFTHDRREALEFSGHLVGAEWHRRHQVRAVFAGDGGARHASFDVDGRDGETRQHGATFIGDNAAQFALSELCGCGGRERRDESEDEAAHQSHDHGALPAGEWWPIGPYSSGKVKLVFRMTR